MIFEKFIFLKQNRLPIVLYNSLYSIANLLWTMLISYVVIKKTSVDFWGEFMTIFTIITFGTHLVKWGNKTYLLKEFSSNPAQIKNIWNTAFYARIPIYLIVSLIEIWYYQYDLNILLLVLLWILSDYIFSSLEAYIVYFKKFKTFFILDLVFILMVLSILFTNGITIKLLLFIYTIRIFIKSIVTVFLFRKNLSFIIKKIDVSLLKKITPFFFIGLIGFLNSKLDFYATLYFLSDTEIGKYHILSNFILFGITLGSYIIVPFEKNIYRLQTQKVKKIAFNFLGLGVFISLLWMFVSKFIILNIYGIDFSTNIYFIGFIYILPIYYYWPILHKLYSKDKINATLLVGLLSVIVNAIFILFLVPLYGIKGTMISAIMGQLVQLIGYIILSRSLTKSLKFTENK